MDREEAHGILNQHLDRFEALGHDELSTRIGQAETLEVATDRGKAYQLEFEAIWDSHPGGTIRVLGSIDDGGLRALMPLSDDRLVPPRSST